MIVLKNRKCGSPQGGGLYAVSELDENGSLNAFTALVAPFPAEIANPRAAQVVDINGTLVQQMGLWPPSGSGERFAGLPPIGFADLWGKAQGYKAVWDVVEETVSKGISRRIAQVPNISLPAPVLMMHMEAMVESTWCNEVWEHDIPELIADGLDPIDTDDWNYDSLFEEKPYLEVGHLGYRGDPTFVHHPHMRLYLWLKLLREQRQHANVKREYGLRYEQGVFGLTWVCNYAYVLREDETDVPEELARKGVLAAIGEDDPRAQDLSEETSWDLNW